MAASISAVVIGPPRSLTGFGILAGRVFFAAMPLRINSAIASFSFFCSCTARILTWRMRSSGRSRVVFISPYSQKAGFMSITGRLSQQPRHDPAGDRDFVDVAPLQLSEEVSRVHGFFPSQSF